jgi:hypothetical protein
MIVLAGLGLCMSQPAGMRTLCSRRREAGRKTLYLPKEPIAR